MKNRGETAAPPRAQPAHPAQLAQLAQRLAQLAQLARLAPLAQLAPLADGWQPMPHDCQDGGTLWGDFIGSEGH